MGVGDLLDFLSGGELPDDDICVAAAGDDHILLWTGIELQAEHRLGMTDQGWASQALSVKIPDPNRLVSAAAHQPLTGELDGINALAVGLHRMIRMRKLKVGEFPSNPIFLQTLALLEQMLPIYLGVARYPIKKMRGVS